PCPPRKVKNAWRGATGSACGSRPRPRRPSSSSSAPCGGGGKVLDYSNIADVLKRLDDDEKGIVSIYTPGGAQSVWCVNEAGLYGLMLNSHKPEAKSFKRWVTHEVIPASRHPYANASPRYLIHTLTSSPYNRISEVSSEHAVVRQHSMVTA